MSADHGSGFPAHGGFNAVLGQGRGAGVRRQEAREAEAEAARATLRDQRAVRRWMREDAAEAACQGPIGRFTFFRPRAAPSFFWTTKARDGFYLSGIVNDAADNDHEGFDAEDLVVRSSVRAHALRREAKARALALRDGWLYAHGRQQ